jgi:hypothetical protein
MRRPQAYDCLHPPWQGPELTCIIKSLPDTRIKFVCRAYDAAGESGDANEATYTPTSPPLADQTEWYADLRSLRPDFPQWRSLDFRLYVVPG